MENNVSRIGKARIANLLYLRDVLFSIFYLLYIPCKRIVWGEAAETFQRTSNYETFFRFGIIVGHICYLAFLLLRFARYWLFYSVDKTIATTMVILGTVGAPIAFINLGNKMAVLTNQ